MNETIFCEHCGKQLLVSFQFIKFNKDDGKKLYKKYYTCPNRKFFWNFLHDRVVGLDQFGDVLFTEEYVEEFKKENSQKLHGL